MLELGGNGPIIVFADADLERAVQGTITGCYLCAGQSCTAGERVLVEERIREEFVALLGEQVARLRLGDPFAPETTLGPLNNDGVARKMDEHVADAVGRGARLPTGGRPAGGVPTHLNRRRTLPT